MPFGFKGKINITGNKRDFAAQQRESAREAILYELLDDVTELSAEAGDVSIEIGDVAYSPAALAAYLRILIESLSEEVADKERLKEILQEEKLKELQEEARRIREMMRKRQEESRQIKEEFKKFMKLLFNQLIKPLATLLGITAISSIVRQRDDETLTK
jgi:CHAT domain-containing protein